MDPAFDPEDIQSRPSRRASEGKWSFADFHSSALAWIILGLSAVITIVAWTVSEQTLTNASKLRFSFKIEDVRSAIEQRMHEQEAALWGGVGLFNTTGNVTRDEWSRFVASLRLERYLPGLQGYGYAETVRPQDRTAHVLRIRGEGFPAFDIRPAGEREIYSSIIYLEPFRDRNLRAFGYDMFSEPTRREAMERARDTGDVAVSGKVTLVQETQNDIQLGFLMYLPVYLAGKPVSTVAERRSALQGFVYSPFRIKDLMGGILGKGDTEIDFRIRDGEARGPLLYDSANDYAADANIGVDQFTATSPLRIGGHLWTLEFRTRSGFISAAEHAQPLMVAAGGILIDILLFLAITSLSNQRYRARLLANLMTEELLWAKEKAEQAAQNENSLRTIAEESNARLKTANERLLAFNRIVAHDLGAPLKRIESFVEILREDHESALEAEGEDILVRIERGSLRMREILNSLHNYAKFGEISIEGKTASLEMVVNGALEDLGREIGSAEIDIDVDEVLWVCGDRDLLVQVLQNLISNAIKFRGESDPEISISARDLGTGVVELSVSDDGIGISPEHAHQVFDMFVRLHSEDEYEGTGIGLSVCKKIVMDHGGDIRIDPTWNKGTRVVVTLERAATPEGTSAETLVA